MKTFTARNVSDEKNQGEKRIFIRDKRHKIAGRHLHLTRAALIIAKRCSNQVAAQSGAAANALRWGRTALYSN